MNESYTYMTGNAFKSGVEQSVVEQSAIEQSAVEQSILEQNAAEQSAVDYSSLEESDYNFYQKLVRKLSVWIYTSIYNKNYFSCGYNYTNIESGVD